MHNNVAEVALYGREFLVNRATMYADGYEEHVFRRLMPLLGPGKRFLDVGADIGMFAVHAALRGAEVLAVEARRSHAALLLENCRRHRVKVELHPLAASDRHGYAVFESPVPDDSIVATGLLDQLIGSRPIDVMRIGIDGHEYRALEGARWMLTRSQPVIVTGYDPGQLEASSGVSGAEYLELLSNCGYRISALLRNGEVRPIGEHAEADAIVQAVGHPIDLLAEPR